MQPTRKLEPLQKSDDIPQRTVLDHVKNSQGLALVDFLSDIRFVILNGRYDPKFDNFTCINSRGESVVDYIAVPYNCMETCSDFRVVTSVDAINRCK